MYRVEISNDGYLQNMGNAKEKRELNFSGKAAVEPLDLCDFVKKQACKKIKNSMVGSGGLELVSSGIVYGEYEKNAIIKFRTERLTAERLFEVLHSSGLGPSVEDIKKELCKVFLKIDISDTKTRETNVYKKIQMGRVDNISIDYLIGQIERFSSDQHLETRINAILAFK